MLHVCKRSLNVLIVKVAVLCSVVLISLAVLWQSIAFDRPIVALSTVVVGIVEQTSSLHPGNAWRDVSMGIMGNVGNVGSMGIVGSVDRAGSQNDQIGGDGNDSAWKRDHNDHNDHEEHYHHNKHDTRDKPMPGKRGEEPVTV